jgi:LysR family transcriptional regulator of abg operon
MKTHQLRALVAIADAGSMRGAARLLNSSAAAIAQNLQLLEEYVHMQLILRTSTGVTLTASGQTLLIHARLIVSQMMRAQEAVDTFRDNSRKRLSIAVSPWVAIVVLPEAVNRFRQRMPEVQLEVFEGLLAIAYPRLRNGGIDIYIGRRAPATNSSEFTYRPLFASSLAVVTRCGHPYAESRSLADLLELDWLLTVDPETEGRAPYQMFVQNGLPTPANIHYTHSLTISIAMLRKSDVVCLFPWPLIEMCAERYGLCPLPLREQLTDALVGINTRTGEPPDTASRCFIDCLLETVRDETWLQLPDIHRAMKTVEILI